MNEIIAVNTPSSNVIVTDKADRANIDDVWWRLFDVPAAVAALDAILADKGSDQTREKHTRGAYESGLRYWMNWAGPKMPAKAMRKTTVYEIADDYPATLFPGPERVRQYIAHLKGRGLKKNTIDNKYMTPLRHYIRALRKQYIGVTGQARDFVSDCKDFLMHSLDEEVSATESYGTLPPLYQHGTRLTVTQVDALFVKVAQGDELIEKRDLAILYIGFNSALRDSELRRLTLSGIRQGKDGWELHVRGKRNNKQPVPLDSTGYTLIMDWVAAYNEALEDNDPRFIGHVDKDGEETVIFQAMRRGNTRREVGDNGFKPKRGMSKTSLYKMLKRRTKEMGGMPTITPHDMRRTAAFIGRQNGMEWDQLQMLLRHRSIDTTRRYVGNPPDLSQSLISKHVTWSVGVA